MRHGAAKSAIDKEERPMDVFERIRSERGSLSNSFAKVADFICGNYEEVAFMSITEVARRSGVSSGPGFCPAARPESPPSTRLSHRPRRP